ncbi:MAG: hypothetical protein SFV51_21400, partial [Bryobacteraceae bacterium]|nr:hypothetical protein [Bryobacteraceae bacterium]
MLRVRSATAVILFAVLCLAAAQVQGQVGAPGVTLTKLVPDAVDAGSPEFVLTVSGTGFATATAIEWNGVRLTTTVDSATQVRAVVPAARLLTAGTASVVARSAEGAVSNALGFTIRALPVPVISRLDPASITAGQPAFPLSLFGSNFSSGSVAVWNGTQRLSTRVESSAWVIAEVPASLIQSPGVAVIVVQNSAGVPSSPAEFLIYSPRPQISSLSPATASTGSGPLTLTVNGAGFVPGAAVRWNGVDLPTVFASSLRLTATVAANLLGTAGLASLTVINPDRQTSPPAQFSVINAAPTISGLTPPSIQAGAAAFTMGVTGANFQSGAVVRWNGAALVTTFSSQSQLSATVPAHLLVSAGTASVTVSNPDGLSSGALSFNVTAASPQITLLEPGSAAAGGPAFSLAVSGANFRAGAVVRWNGTALPTTFLSAGELLASVGAERIAAPGSALVTVANLDGLTSGALSFTIGPAPAPQLTGLNPVSATAGGGAFTLQVNGANFRNGSVVQWNGTPLVTTFSNANQLAASVTAALIANAGAASVIVVNPDGQSSQPLNFAISSPAPQISGLNPPSVQAGGATFSLTVNGANFQNGAVVRWNGSALSTTFLGQNQLAANVTSALILNAGAASVTVTNPDGQTSLSATFTIAPPGPQITSLNPSSAIAGGTGFTLVVTGANFLNTAVVQWNGAALPTTFNSASQLTAAVASQLIANPGSSTVTVANPDGQTATPAAFTISAPAPQIISLNPSSAAAGSAAFAMTVNGLNFRSGAVVRWNETALVTSVLSPGQLTANVGASLVANAGSAAISVANSDGQASQSLPFTITALAPQINSLSPSSALAGGAAFVMTIAGSNFRSGATAQWNGTALATNVLSATQLTANVTAAQIANPGPVSVVVANTDGPPSQPATFTVTAPAPQITGLSPSSAVAGGAAFAMTVNGANFRAGAVVQWNGTPLATTVLSASQLSANVTAALIAGAGSISITVANTDGQSSAAFPFTVAPQPPQLISLTPSSVPAGSAALSLTASGSNFRNGAMLRWNGADLPTVFVSATQLTATVQANLLASVGTALLTVVNSDGQSSGPLTFSITVPPPQITSLSPASAQAGSPAFTLAIAGANFQNGAVARWNTTPLNTTFLSAGQLTAEVPATLIATAGTATVSVTNADTQTSGAVQFTVSPAAAPQISSLSPASAVAGSAAITLVVSGAGFRSGAVLRWNDTPLATVFGSNSQLSATVTAALIASPGSANLTVLNPDGQSSAPVVFPVTAPAPRLTSLTPASAFAGGAAFTITAQGSAFVQGATLRWNGTPLATTFVSASTLTAVVPANLTVAPVVAAVAVINPDGQISSPVNFTVELAPRPEITSLSPSTTQARGAAFVMTVQGRNFQSGAVVRWNGSALPTVFVSATQLTADVAANLITAAGSASIVVATPDGQLTAPSPFVISARPPRISALSPNSAQATGPAFSMRITGSDFASGSTARWNGTALATTVVSDTELSANVPASLIASPGNVAVTVTNADGQASEAAAFTVTPAPSPAILSLAPNTVQAAGQAFELTVEGANFQNGAVVKWNGAALATTFVSASRLAASVSAGLIASAGSPAITVANPDGQMSAAVVLTVTPAPAPVITSIDPNAARSGDPAISLSVFGTGFQNGAVVRWNGSALPTTFVSATQLSANVAANLLSQAGQVSVAAANPDGQISAAVIFRINALPPKILSFTPTSIQAGSATFALSVQGSDFQSGAVVRWNNTALVTTFGSAAELSASVPASLIQSAGSASITVVNPDGQSSLAVNFSVGAAPAPLVTSLSPASVQAGAAGFTLTVAGSNFQTGAVVRWNGAPLTTFQATPTQITASVASALVAAAGSASVTVQNPDGQSSTATSFTINAPPPQVSALNPASIQASGPAFTLTVQGAAFQNGATVLWSGTALTTTFVSAAQLTAAVPASLIAQQGAVQVSVRNPDSQTSNETAFTISSAPKPSISGINPSTIAAGSPTTVFTLTGVNFRAGAVVSWGGTQLATTFVTATQVTAVAPALLLANPVAIAVTLRNPDGQVSDPFPLNVTAPAPLLTVLAPAAVPAASAEFSLTLLGQNFRAGVEARWNGTPLPTVFVSSSELTATVNAALIAAPGAASVTVRTPEGSISGPLPFTILNPIPQLLSLSRSSIMAGAVSFVLTATGERFVPGAQVLFNGTALATSFLSVTQLSAQVPAELVARPGAVSVSVRNPENQTSNSLRFNVTEVSVPEISRLNPSSAAQNGPAFPMAVSGFNFLNGADVLWNGAVLQTSFISATQLTANVPASLLTALGQAAVTVRNPGGQTSQPVAFEIGQALRITSLRDLEDAAVGKPMKAELAASGGAKPYRWAVSAGSALPDGLTLDSAGVMQGIPAIAGEFLFEIEVRDAVNSVDRLGFRLKILPRLLEILSRSP